MHTAYTVPVHCVLPWCVRYLSLPAHFASGQLVVTGAPAPACLSDAFISLAQSSGCVFGCGCLQVSMPAPATGGAAPSALPLVQQLLGRVTDAMAQLGPTFFQPICSRSELTEQEVGRGWVCQATNVAAKACLGGNTREWGILPRWLTLQRESLACISWRGIYVLNGQALTASSKAREEVSAAACFLAVSAKGVVPALRDGVARVHVISCARPSPESGRGTILYAQRTPAPLCAAAVHAVTCALTMIMHCAVVGFRRYALLLPLGQIATFC